MSLWLWAVSAIFVALYKCNAFCLPVNFSLGSSEDLLFEIKFSLRMCKLTHLHTWLTWELSVPSVSASSALRIIFWVHLFSFGWYNMTTKFVKWKLKMWVLDYENEVFEEPQSSQSEKNWIVFQVCARQQLRISARAEEGMNMQKPLWILDFIIRQFWWYVTGEEEEKGMHLNLFCKFLELGMNSGILLCYR